MSDPRCDWAWTGGPRCHSISRLHECELAPHGIAAHHLCYHCGATHPGAPPPVDPVNHPPHYTAHPSGIEAIQITEHMGFCLGNAVKYLWRADEKGAPVEDLEKAVWYIQREIRRRTPSTDDGSTP